ncbi:hypothetical protein QBC46DRAFT_389763 [Diplogelasinospora grovesii]|uniref:Ubiquitin 3 binding protein But2 C-terminal domain-containing protein n=1 Tax=Diplogelasinospora grovesii TaxID=303347 RepID=A0AAN6S303_9PEZI|nr:hypothetical protein QBC46DRAFT_389763 [Diplogelasinospora grovesii]
MVLPVSPTHSTHHLHTHTHVKTGRLSLPTSINNHHQQISPTTGVKMAKMTILAGLLGIFALNSAAAASPGINTTPGLEARTCTTGPQAPYDIITYDLSAPDTPGWSTNPYFEAARNYDGTGYKQLLRFAPPPTGTCSWVMNLPSSRMGEVLQGKPAAGPVTFAFYGVQPNGYAPGSKLADLQVKPGPFGVNAVQEGTQVIHAEPCNQIGGELLVQIPDWITEQMWAYWRQDIRAGDAANSLGIYMQVARI